MLIREYKIADNVNLEVYPTDKFKTGLLSMSLAFPLDKEKSPLNSLLFSVLKRGTEKYPSLAKLNQKLDDLYGTTLSIKNHRLGDMQILGFTAEFLKNEYIYDGTDIIREVTDVIFQMLFHPLLDSNSLLNESILENEKIKFCDEIRAQKNNTSAYALKRLRECMCENEAYGVSLSGDVPTIMAVNPEKLTRHMQNCLDSAYVHFFYVGSDNPDKIAETLSSSITSEKVSFKPKKFINHIVRTANKVRNITENMQVSQSKLVLGMRSGVALNDSDYFSTMLFNEIFGVMQVSKLFMNVREKLGLCYYCNSTYSSYKGIITVSSGISAKNYSPALDEIMKQLSLLKSGGISENELVCAKKSIISAFNLLYDSPSALETFYSGRILSGIDDRSIEDSIEKINSVTMDDVIKSAQKVDVDTIFFLQGTSDDCTREEDCYD